MTANTAAVILAAGASSRFGSPKQLLVHDGQSLVRRVAHAASDAGLDPVIVVLGASPALIASELSGMKSVTMVINDDWKSGQASSLRTGLVAAAEMKCDAAVVMLADQPLVDAGSLRRILASFGNAGRIVASEYGGIIGAPAMFGCEYFQDLMELDGDAGAGKWLRGHSSEVTTIALPEAAVDVDTPADVVLLRGA
jgi:molybdenum cofactor cytidylyltransferase